MRRASGSVEVVVTRGKDVLIDRVVTFAGGEATAVAEGPAPAAGVTLTLTASDARAVRDGTLDLDVAFMRGQMKMSGDFGLLLDVLPRTREPAFAPVREQVLTGL